MAAAAAVLGGVEGPVGWPPLIGAASVTALVAAVVAAPRDGALRARFGRVRRLAPALIVAVAFLQPTGLELTGSWLGWPRDPRWEQRLHPEPALARALAIEVAAADPTGAGAFLQARLAESGPFRYVGYGGYGHLEGGGSARAYMDRRFQPNIQAILVNARPVFLGLYEIQGYDPIQLARYVEFMAALNGQGQGYHTNFLLPTGVRSPLLDLLNVRYVLVDATLPQDRADVVALTDGRREVFRTPLVVVYERVARPPHAWIVHDVRAVARGEALPLLTGGTVDPRRTALVEGSPPESRAPPEPAAESAEVTRYKPDALTITTKAAAPGLLVVSEVYETGWRAYVDGEPVDVLPTDHVLRGVPIPAGEHVVELRYEPLALRLGLPITGITALAMLVALAAAWRRRRSRTLPPADPGSGRPRLARHPAAWRPGRGAHEDHRSGPARASHASRSGSLHGTKGSRG
jgi:hypothetical protein